MSQSSHHAVWAALLAAALLLLATSVPTARAQYETENEKEFSYVRGAKNGPERWGKINKNWTKCGTGEMQSPIDLSDKRVKLVRSLGYLNHSYRPAEASIVNRGHDIMVKFGGDAGSLVINGTTYNLHQIHWHSPSEHTVNGRRYDMELHMVHETVPNKTAVIGILYKVGNPDEFLRKLEPFLKLIADRKDEAEPIGVVDPRDARGKANAYYRYMGSLTTPPCTEGVIWTLVTEVRSVSKRQLQLLREAVHDGMEDNARPLQELNNRNISLFKPYPLKYN
ncbi:hypothetical protein PR202_ga21238 [Eleusine coracana subsp. coracana]|uniref:Carbonic anhydrase n=1 Tax=Eleusine coracana subsp. coracana TaxID=191504 RepID=A0AAV5D139_ELECO|nr:hypothetical protein PR202_ga21238 [Eleusine coracana subsp. coracana]